MSYDLLFDDVRSDCQKLNHHPFLSSNIELYIQREDLIHPEISGNKWRKLKYNFIQAKKEGKGVLTFGGAYSNHIAATAAAGREYDLPTIGIIRGDELSPTSNKTLRRAEENGMQLHFVSRADYKLRNDSSYLKELMKLYPGYLIVPEGGANELGVEGCKEILREEFDIAFVAAGTGSTAAGIIESGKVKMVYPVSVLKGDFLKQEIKQWTNKSNWELLTDYHFGGYAKRSDVLDSFQEQFEKEFQVLLDPVYTSKLMYAAFDFISKSDWNNLKIVLVHTGGIQGRQ